MGTHFFGSPCRTEVYFLFLTKAAATVSYCENYTDNCLNGSSEEFHGQQTLSFEVNTPTCTVEGYQYKYRPKSCSDVQTTPLVGHLKRKHPNF